MNCRYVPGISSIYSRKNNFFLSFFILGFDSSERFCGGPACGFRGVAIRGAQRVSAYSFTDCATTCNCNSYSMECDILLPRAFTMFVTVNSATSSVLFCKHIFFLGPNNFLLSHFILLPYCI